MREFLDHRKVRQRTRVELLIARPGAPAPPLTLSRSSTTVPAQSATTTPGFVPMGEAISNPTICTLCPTGTRRSDGDNSLEDNETWLTIRPDITSLVTDTVLSQLLGDDNKPASNDDAEDDKEEDQQ